MHDVLRQRLLRRIESLPENQIYQVLDFVEFLESKYARQGAVEPSALQKFAENIEDGLRRRAMNPAVLREAFQLISAADRVLTDVSQAGKEILNELGAGPEPGPGGVSGSGSGSGRDPGGSSRNPGGRPREAGGPGGDPDGRRGRVDPSTGPR